MWNYRVVRRKQTWIDPGDGKEKGEYSYAIHEAYYDKNGYVGAITQDPVEPFGENMEELRHSWMMMAEAFGQSILDYDNIPEPGYDRKADPVGSVLDERLQEHETSGAKEAAVPWEEVEREREEPWGPFDPEGYRRQREQERIDKERLHGEVFSGTPSLKALINKMYSDYQAWTERDRAANPWKDSAEDT